MNKTNNYEAGSGSKNKKKKCPETRTVHETRTVMEHADKRRKINEPDELIDGWLHYIFLKIKIIIFNILLFIYYLFIIYLYSTVTKKL